MDKSIEDNANRFPINGVWDHKDRIDTNHLQAFFDFFKRDKGRMRCIHPFFARLYLHQAHGVNWDPNKLDMEPLYNCVKDVLDFCKQQLVPCASLQVVRSLFVDRQYQANSYFSRLVSHVLKINPREISFKGDQVKVIDFRRENIARLLHLISASGDHVFSGPYISVLLSRVLALDLTFRLFKCYDRKSVTEETFRTYREKISTLFGDAVDIAREAAHDKNATFSEKLNLAVIICKRLKDDKHLLSTQPPAEVSEKIAKEALETFSELSSVVHQTSADYQQLTETKARWIPVISSILYPQASSSVSSATSNFTEISTPSVPSWIDFDEIELFT